MTNKLKFFVASVAAVAFVFAGAQVSNAAYVHAGLLKQGSRGTQVLALQQALNATAYKVALTGVGSAGYETTLFGPATKAAVIKFQAANGLVADGIVGASTGAKLAGLGGTTVPSGLPAGCTSTSGFSPVTGVACNTTSSNTGGLSGGAGDLDTSSTTKGTKSTVAENSEEKVLGVKVEANDSDIAITNVKIEFVEDDTTSGSYRLDKYVDEVLVYLGDKEVGSVDGDDFNRSSKTYSKSISLKNAVVKEGKDDTLYVAVATKSSVDDVKKKFEVSLSGLRFTDATGAIISDTSVTSGTFGFAKEGKDDEVRLSSSKSNPAKQTFEVDEDSESDEFHVLSASLKTGKKSGEVNVLGLEVEVDMASADLLGSSEVGDVIETIEVNGVEADLKSSTNTNAVFTVDFEDDFIIDGDDEEEVEVIATFAGQDGIYKEGAKVTFVIKRASILAEGAAELTAKGSTTVSSKVHTLVAGNIEVSFTEDPVASEPLGNGTTGTIEFSIEIENNTGSTLDVAVGDFKVKTTGYAGVAVSSVVLAGTSTPATTLADGDTEEYDVILTFTGKNSSNFSVTIEEIDGVAVAVVWEE